jgi:predicted nucleotidyltransferase
MNQYFPSTTVLAGYRGSIAHGTYVPNTDPNSTDDVDVMGIHMCPPEFYIGFGDKKKDGHKIEVMEIFESPYDMVFYEFRKFVKLLIKANPNKLSLLWIRDQDYIVRKPYGQILIQNRDWFTTKHIYGAFVKYAENQFKRMTHCNYDGYMGAKRKALVEKYGFDCYEY